MTTPPSRPVPPGYPPGAPPRPQRFRPSWAWFVVGAALIVVGLAVGVGLAIWTLSPFFSTDARVPTDGRPHVIEVGTDGDRMLWHDDDLDALDCRIVDLASARELPLRPAGSTLTRETPGDGELVGGHRFAPGSGDLEVTCRATTDADDGPAKIVIGPAPSLTGFVGGLIAAIAVSGALGILGLATLIITGVLWATRPARSRT